MKKATSFFAFMKSHKVFSVALSAFLLCAITCTVFVFGSQSGIFSTGDMPFANAPAHGLSVDNLSDSSRVDTDLPNASQANSNSDISRNSLASITKNPIESLTDYSPAADVGNNKANSAESKAVFLINPNNKSILPQSVGYTEEDAYAVEFERIGDNNYYAQLIKVADSENEKTIFWNSYNSWFSDTSYSYATDKTARYISGRTYIVSNGYTYNDGRRFSITDLKIYKKTDGVKTDETVDVTKNDDGTFTFTMPACEIKMEATVKDNMHTTFPYQNMTGMGTITVVPCDGSKMYGTGSSTNPINSVTLTESQEYISGYIYAIENDKLNFTVNPKEGISKLKSIGVYGWYNNNYKIVKDSSGNILNPKIEGCLEKNEDGTYTLTIPSQNSMVYAEYENGDNIRNVEYTRTVIPSDGDYNSINDIFHIKDAAGEKTLMYDGQWRSEWTLRDRSYSDAGVWTAGRTYNISNNITAFNKKGWVLTDVEIFEKDADGNVTDKKVPVTKNEDGTFTFEMPKADIKITANYKYNVYNIYLAIPQEDRNMGTLKLVPNEGCELYRSKKDSYSGDGKPGISGSSTSDGPRGVIYNDTATLTVTPVDPITVSVGSVKAYKCYEGRNEIKKDIGGNILNEEIQGVVNDNGDGTYTITHPESDYILYTDYSTSLHNVEYECAGISSCYFDKLFTVTDSENEKTIRYNYMWHSELYAPYKNMKNSDTAWTAGRTYTVAHKFEGYSKKHFEFTDLTIYKKDENGELTGETVPVEKSEDGFSYTFVMPDCDVKVVPTYRDLLYAFYLKQDAFHMGNLTLEPYNGGIIFNSNITNGIAVTNPTVEVNENSESSPYKYISEHDKMKLTVETKTDTKGTPLSRVKSVGAYAKFDNRLIISTNNDGIIKNEKLDGVIEENEDGTYTITSPSQEFIIYVEYEYSENIYRLEYQRAANASWCYTNIAESNGEDAIRLSGSSESNQRWVSLNKYRNDTVRQYSYYIADREYIVSNNYTGYDNNRFEITDVEIYKKNADGEITDERVDVTKNEDGTFTFTMPRCNISLQPIYRDKLYKLSFQHNIANVGSSVIKPNDGYTFYNSNGSSPSRIDEVSLPSNYAEYNVKFTYFIFNHTAVLTDTITDPEAYRIKSVTAYNTANAVSKDKDGNITNEPIEGVVQKNADGTYTITQPDSDCLIYIEYEPNTDKFNKITLSSSSTASIKAIPKLSVKGNFEGLGGESSIDIPYNNGSSDGKSVEGKLLQGSEAALIINDDIGHFVYTPITITVTNSSGEVLETAEYCNGEYKYEKNGFFAAPPVTAFTLNKLGFNAEFKFTMQNEEVNINVKVGETYTPLIVNQYVVDGNGSQTLVNESDGFTTDIIAALPQSASIEALYPAAYQKFFTQNDLSRLAPFTQSFIVNGGTYTCSYLTANNGNINKIAAKPSPANGYMLSKVEALSYNRDGEVVNNSTSAYFSKSLNGITDAYICTNGGDRSAQLVINVYYARQSSLTVNQTINAFLNTTSSEQMGSVEISDYNKENRNGAYPFVLDTGETVNTRTYNSVSNDTSSNHIIDQERNIHTWSYGCGVTPETGIQVKVTPKGIRNIVDFTPYVIVGEERRELDYTLISGTGLPETPTIYKINDLVGADQRIYINIEYGQAQTLTVDVRMLDDNNAVVANSTNTKVTVKGALTTADGVSTLKPFRRNYDDTEYFDTIETRTKDTVFTFSNTKLDINTALDHNSGYVIANVVAYEADENGKPTNQKLNIAPDKIESQNIESTALDFSHCTMSSLPVSKNAVIIVYLARTSTMTISVYTANDAGEYLPGNGTGNDNSYVNLSGDNSLIGYNPQTIVTTEEEGNYNTDKITITNNPPKRTTKVLQGSVINAFAQLPNEDYIISKIIVKYKQGGEEIIDNSAYCGSTRVVKDPNTNESYLRVDFGTRAQILPNRDDYTVDVYLARARNIRSRVQGHDLDGYIRHGGGGTVTAVGECITDPQVTNPFTRIYNDGSRASATNSYNAAGYDPVLAKCMQGTKISLNVKPDSGFMIRSVAAYVNSLEGAEIKLEASEPDANQMVTYTLVNDDGTPYLMPVFSDVYIEVHFDEIPKDSEVKFGKINLDLTYTDDLENFKPMSDEAVKNVISAENMHLGNKNLLIDESNDLVTQKQLESNKQNYSFKVKTVIYDGRTYNTNVTVAGTYVDGKYYLPHSVELTDSEGNVLSTYGVDTYFNRSYSARVSVAPDKEYNLKVRLMPVSEITINQYENNHYGNLENVPETSQFRYSWYSYNESVKLTAENDKYNGPITGNTLGSLGGRNSGYGNQISATPKTGNFFIVKGSDVKFTVDIESPLPGVIAKVAVLENGREIENAVNLVGEENGLNKYEFNFKTEADKKYTITVNYDCIDLITYTNESAWNGYLVWSDNTIDQVDIYNSETYNEKLQIYGDGKRSFKRLPKEYAQRTGHMYLIAEQNVPHTSLFIRNATFMDYKDDYVKDGILDNDKIDFTETLKNQTFEREVGGLTKYYYWYEVKPENEPETPLDNSMEFTMNFDWKRVDPIPVDPTPDPDKDCQLTVTQYERTSNTGFVETLKGDIKVSLASGDQFKYGDNYVDSFSVPVDLGSGVLNSSSRAITKVGQTAVLKITPPKNYIVSEVELQSGGGSISNYKAASDNVYYIRLRSGIENINVYYSQPLVTISTNNTSSVPKGTVEIDGSTVIAGTQFMNSTLVNAGDSKKVVITPLTYNDSNGVTQKYHVSYILKGNSRNSMLLMEPSKYTVDEETGVINIELDNISDDVDMHIQFEGETEEKKALLIVSHHIKIGDEYEDSTYGKVITTGTLLGTENPITLMDGTPCSQFELTTDSSVTTAVLEGTKLDFNVTPPENFKVDKVEGRFASATDADYSENLTFTIEGSKYTLDNTMPDSGVVFVDVYYGVETFKVTYDGNGNTAGEAPTDEKEYLKNEQATVLGKNTLEKENYKFLGWSRDKNSTEAEYAEGEKLTVTEDVILYAVWEEMPTVKLVYKYIDRFNMQKQYVVVTHLTQAEIENNNVPSAETLKKNAPYITDLFKKCVWDTENAVTANGVTEILAKQENYTYKIYFSAGTPAEHETIYDSGSMLAGSRYVEKKFNQCFDITAEKENEGVPFKYWVASDVDDSGSIIPGTEKIVCYTEKYNYRVTKNLSIRPVYENSTKDWAVTLGKPLYTREQYTDEEGNGKKDYVYSDYLISIFQPENRMLDEILASGANVQFGVILDSDTSITYDGTGEVQYPMVDVDTVKAVIAGNTPQNGKTVTTTQNGHKYYMYDRTEQAVTNKNRCDFYIRFANTLKNESTVFNVYAYVIVDGKIYISNRETLNIYDCGKAEYTAE